MNAQYLSLSVQSVIYNANIKVVKKQDYEAKRFFIIKTIEAYEIFTYRLRQKEISDENKRWIFRLVHKFY